MITRMVIAFLVFAASNCFSQKTEFRLQFPDQANKAPITGRAILMLSGDTLAGPDVPNPFQPFIAFGMNFKNWNPGETLVLDQAHADAYRSQIDSLSGWYSLRAVLDVDSTSSILFKDGILYSEKIVFQALAGRSNPVDVKVGNVVAGRGFKERENIKLARLQSKRLSRFYHFPTFIEGAVVLPDSYEKDIDRYYPVVFVFPGWGTTHVSGTRGDFQLKRYGMSGYGEEKIFVLMNQDCGFGFHVFADSKNNGPRATSFIKEFIPFLEKEFRIEKKANARFLVGQSSGAWAALWLLVHYPDQFGMAWAASPDPLDFRDFVGHNLYADSANLFYDSEGRSTPAVRKEGISFTNKEWSNMETALGDGGQYQSFEAVFGRKGRSNRPEPVFDRTTGEISKDAIRHWEKYDISLIINDRWKKLRPKLAGKISIVVAGDDDFFLDGSVRLFKKTLDDHGFDANIRVLAEGGHETWNDEIRNEMHAKMDSLYLKQSK